MRLYVFGLLTMSFVVASCTGATTTALSTPIAITESQAPNIISGYPIDDQQTTITSTKESRYASPYGEWEAIVTTEHHAQESGEPFIRKRLEVVNTTQEVTWLLTEMDSPVMSLVSSPLPIYWSSDGLTMVYAIHHLSTYCGFFQSATEPNVVDLQSGRVTPMWSALEGRELSISEDGQWMVAVELDPSPTLELLNISADQLYEYPLQGNDVTGLRFSPAGDALVLTVISDPCIEDEMRRVIHLDLNTLEISVIWGPSPDRLITKDWTTEGVVLVESLSNNPPMLLDIDTGELTPE